MIIHRLKVAGFRIMGDVTEIEFPEEGRIGILGPNESGKTTLFQAIEFVLFGLKKGSGAESDRQNLVTWGKNEAKLEIEFTSGQNRYNLQRVFNTKLLHKAVLTPIINGQKDRTNAVTNLKEVENKIVQITGMDRDSFCKLVYIKQKDLDALKELAKSKREQLVNKVMGIELFDDAASSVKFDASEREDDLEKAEIRLQAVEQNKEEYESKLSQKTTLVAEIEQKEEDLKEKDAETADAKDILEKYEWLSSYKSANETKCSLIGQMNQVEKDLQTIQKLNEEAKNLKTTIEKYKPEILKLRSLRDNLSELERKLAQAQSTVESLQTQESGLTEEITKQQEKLTEKQKVLDDAKGLVSKYEWLQRYAAETEIETSLANQVDQVEKEIFSLNKLVEDKERFNATLKKYKPELLELQVLSSNLTELEKHILQAEDKLRSLQSQKQTLIDKSGFSDNDIKLLSKDISKEKSSRLQRFGITTTAGAVCLIGAFLLASVIFGSIGIAIVALAAYFFSQYLRIDKLIMQNIEIEAVNKQLVQEENSVRDFQTKKNQTTLQIPFKDSQDVQQRLSSISELMNQETGVSTIEGIEAVLRSKDENIITLKNSNPQNRKTSLESQLNSKRTEIKQLENNKPDSISTTNYNKNDHDSSKKRLESIQTEYDNLKQILNNTEGTVNTIRDQIKNQLDEIEQLRTKQKEATSDSPIKKADEANIRLIELSNILEKETDENSIEATEALLKSKKEQSNQLNLSNPIAVRNNLEKQIGLKQSEIEKLEKTKPEDIDKMEYSEDLHTTAKAHVDNLQKEHITLNTELGNKKGTLQQIEKDLGRLKPDFDSYPNLKDEVESTNKEIHLLKRVNFELSETSKDMRNKVLPHARFIINNILPTLTSDRYSDFEITEDLKFKVHSNEAGGFKEREIFSGGTQDQFLIALRLAFTESILDSRVMADKYSLLMDECTASSDEIRKQGIFEVLSSMKETFSQIFIIAHEDIATFVDHNMVIERNERGYTQIKSKSW
jgi:DNA repair protein SbcC/Rad50